MTGRRKGGRAICIPTLYHDPCQRPSALPQSQPACVRMPQVKIHPCLLSRDYWCPLRSHAACVPHPSAPAAPSRQALAPGSLPLGKGTQARSKQASPGIRSLSSWTKCSAGRGSGTGRRGHRLSEKKTRRDKGRKETEAETQRGKEGLSQRRSDGQKEEKAETERRTEEKARGD